MKPVILLLVFAVLVAPVQAGSSLTVLIRRGEGSKARAGESSPTRIEALVSDETGRPIPNATVTFTLPRVGATGVFASGLSSESVLTASDGTASVAGISWGDTPGAVLIDVKASRNGETGAAVVTLDLMPAAGGRPTVSKGASRSKWILAVAAAGAALAGVALAGGKGGAPVSSAATQTPALAAPTVGAPTISIGKP